MIPDRTYSSKEVAQILGKSLKTLSRLLRDRKIGYLYDGGAVRYLPCHVEQYFKKYEVRPL